jgi:hypothetical protein
MARLDLGALPGRQLMDGLSDAVLAYNNVHWPDAELIGMSIEYGDLILTIREPTGGQRRITCEGHEMVGMWDEENGPFATRCMASIERRLRSDRLPSGCESRNRGLLLELTLELSDGCEIRIAMTGLRILPE